MYYVYILRSQTSGRFYVGSTQDVENRLGEHNAGESKSTLAGRPWVALHAESYPTLAEARRQERKIKARGIGRYLSNKVPSLPMALTSRS
jgi:putative endonuclease